MSDSTKLQLALPFVSQQQPLNSPANSSGSGSPSLLVNRRRSSFGFGSNKELQVDFASIEGNSSRTPVLGELDEEGKSVAGAIGRTVMNHLELNGSSSRSQIDSFLMRRPRAFQEESIAFGKEIQTLITEGKYFLVFVGTKGINSSYFLVNRETSKRVAIFKAQAAEIESSVRSRVGIMQGQLCLTEAAAMELGENTKQQRLVPFPPTVLLKISGKIPDLQSLEVKGEQLVFEKSEEGLIASFQKYVEPSELTDLKIESIDAIQIQRLALFDLLSLNTDRNSQNFILSSLSQLIPIDHGCCFPAGFQDPCIFVWLEHPGIYGTVAPELVEYVRFFDAEQAVQDVRGYFSQSNLATLSNFQKVAYPSDKDPKFVEKRLQSLYFAMRIVQEGIRRGINLGQLGLLFSYSGKFAERDLSKESKQALVDLYGASGADTNLTSGRICEESWKKISLLIDENKPIHQTIESEVDTLLNRFVKVWQKMFTTSEELVLSAFNGNTKETLSVFFETSEGKSLFRMIQQEKLYEKLLQLSRSESNLNVI